jgi:hypothetical protein
VINASSVAPPQAPTSTPDHPPIPPINVHPSSAPSTDSLPPLPVVADVPPPLAPQILNDPRPHSLASDSLPRDPTIGSRHLPLAVPNVPPPPHIHLPPAGSDVPLILPPRSFTDIPRYHPTNHPPTQGGMTSGNAGHLTVPGPATTSGKPLPGLSTPNGTPHTPTYRDIVEHGLARPFIQFVRECGFTDIPSDFSMRQEFVSTFLKIHPELRGSTEALPGHATYTVAAIYHLHLQDSFVQWLQTYFGLDWAIGNYVVKCNFATAFLLEESYRRPGLWEDIPNDVQFHASLERMLSVL